MAAGQHPDRSSRWDIDPEDPWISDGSASFDPFSPAQDGEDLADPFATSHVPYPAAQSANPRPDAGAAGSAGAGRSGLSRFSPRRPGKSRPVLGRPRTAADPGATPPPAVRSEDRGVRRTTYLPAVLVLTGGAAAAVCVYLAFDEIRPLSTDPLGSALTLFAFAALGLTLCTVGLIVAVRGAVVGRPRHRPVIAILLAVLLVPVLVGGAGSMGLDKAKRTMQDSAVGDMGRTFVSVLEFIENEGIDLGPLRVLSDQQDGGQR